MFNKYPMKTHDADPADNEQENTHTHNTHRIKNKNVNVMGKRGSFSCYFILVGFYITFLLFLVFVLFNSVRN